MKQFIISSDGIVLSLASFLLETQLVKGIPIVAGEARRNTDNFHFPPLILDSTAMPLVAFATMMNVAGRIWEQLSQATSRQHLLYGGQLLTICTWRQQCLVED